jgi:hypothetical protein
LRDAKRLKRLEEAAKIQAANEEKKTQYAQKKQGASIGYCLTVFIN